ncbi:MAG: 3-dehydroquinate synthase [Myxococcota bacterium]
MRIFLSGPMGAGKSTVASRLANRLGLISVDLDREIESREGMSITEIFRARGEIGFRALERAAALELCKRDNVVVALGGGTAVHGPSRHALLQSGLLVSLTAPPTELAKRVRADATRPLLEAGDPEQLLEETVAARAGAYAECHLSVSTLNRSPDEVAALVAKAASTRPVVVPLGSRTYRVHIGSGVRSRLPQEVRAVGSQSVLVVSDSNVFPRWGEEIEALLSAEGIQVHHVVLPAGEPAKTMRSVEEIWDRALEFGMDRTQLVLALGGGMVGDLAAFAASTILRGVPLGQVPTSLLAMVDSSVGGKTGFNRGQGKNLIGSFYQPRFVLCDLDCLSTLQQRERVSGLAEVVKAAWLAGPEAVAYLERHAESLRQGSLEVTEQAVRSSIDVKVRCVVEDEHEQGRRMLLNLGHTVGHAIEAAGGYARHLHGEAVALGMAAAVRIGRSLGRMDSADGTRLLDLCRNLGLPTELDPYLNREMLAFLGSDKKRRGNRINFVVPGAPGDVGIEAISIDRLREILLNHSGSDE